MKQKILHIFIILIFFIGCSYLYGDEYWEYRDINNDQQLYTQSIKKNMHEFRVDDILELKGSEVFITPDLDLLDTIVDQIDEASEKVYLEVYIFTERDIRDALIRAHKRGVEVKVLLENNPYKAPYLNDNHYNDLQDAGVNVRWSDPLNYSLNHSKLLIIDQIAYISTGNFSYSLFKYNRDILIKMNEIGFVKTLTTLFIQDFEHMNLGIFHKNLILSPDYSRQKLTEFIESASDTIDFYFPYITDEDFQNKLFYLAQKGISIRGIVGKEFYKDNSDIIEIYAKNNIELRPINTDKLHAKMILIDKQKSVCGK